MIKQSLAKISVVMPLRNEEARVAQALTAILAQKRLPREIILVNNASTDRTQAIAQSFRSKFKAKGVKLLILSEETIGLAPARNRGFFAASQAIIASTDADCRVHLDWLAQIERHFQEFDSVAVTGVPIFDDASLLIKLITEHNYYLFLTRLIKFYFGFQPITTATAAILKTAFLEVGGFDDSQRSHYDLDDCEIASRLNLIGPVRVDVRIRVNASFRRHRQLLPAIKINYRRFKTLGRISKQYRSRLQQNKKAD